MADGDQIYDVIIIGGGPAGLSAAQYAARARLKTVVIDKSPTAGALAYAHLIENYPGFLDPIPGKELLDTFRKQAEKFGAEIVTAQVIGVNLTAEVKEVFTMDASFRGKTVIIATGSMGRKPSIKGEAEFLGKGVSYCAVCDAAFFRDKVVCVLGNSEEAVKEAGYLTRFASAVHLISPTSQLKVDDHPALHAENLKVLAGHTVTLIEGEETVKRIHLADGEKKATTLDMDGVFVYIQGSKPIVDFLYGTMPLTEEECIESNRMMQTPIAGVYAAGDVTCTEVRQVVTAVSNGAVAALSAEMFVQHRSRRRYDWSK